MINDQLIKIVRSSFLCKTPEYMFSRIKEQTKPNNLAEISVEANIRFPLIGNRNDFLNIRFRLCRNRTRFPNFGFNRSLTEI